VAFDVLGFALYMTLPGQDPNSDPLREPQGVFAVRPEFAANPRTR
jgi:hypothetical protein